MRTIRGFVSRGGGESLRGALGVSTAVAGGILIALSGRNLVVSFTAFFLIVSAIGSALTLLLVSVFPARRARDIFGVITVAAAGGVVLLIRLLRPESLAKPEGFRNLGEFMAVLGGSIGQLLMPLIVCLALYNIHVVPGYIYDMACYMLR